MNYTNFEVIITAPIIEFKADPFFRQNATIIIEKNANASFQVEFEQVVSYELIFRLDIRVFVSLLV